MGAVSVTSGGTLIYRPAPALLRLEWFDMDGRSLGAFGEPADFAAIEISPKGDKAAASIRREDGRFDLWLCDTVRGTRSKIVEDVGNGAANWSPDAARLSYSDRTTHCRIREVAGAMKDTELTEGWSTDWSRDGKQICIARQEASTFMDIHLIGPEGGEPRPFKVSAAREQYGTFSPDSAWVAYISNATGQTEVVIAPFSGAGDVIQVAATNPSFESQYLWWLDDGTLIHIDTSGRKLVAVPITFKDGVPQLGAPKPAFGGLEIPSIFLDISPDGKRLLAAVPVNKGGAESLILIQNWPTAIAPGR
jgi:hypothetical protein